MTRHTEAHRRRQSIVFAAVERYSKKVALRSDLEAGSAYAISAKIEGKLDGEPKFTKTIAGILSVGQPYERVSSVGAPVEEVIAGILETLAPSKRSAVIASLVGRFQETGSIMAPDPRIEQAKSLLEQLRASKSKTVAGTVSFKLES